MQEIHPKTKGVKKQASYKLFATWIQQYRWGEQSIEIEQEQIMH
jgi:hypothetical protein